jgi:hypothetical protein
MSLEDLKKVNFSEKIDFLKNEVRYKFETFRSDFWYVRP